MSNLPKWISVEEHLPEHGQPCAVYEEFEHRTLGRHFEVTRAIYFSDVNKACSEEDYLFNARELDGVNSGFFYLSDNGEGDCFADLMYNIHYWMPAYGVCDTTTSDQ